MPLPTRPIVAVLGSGAVGGYYGARLASLGLEVHFLFRADYDAATQTGLVIQSRDGDMTIAPSQLLAHRDVATMPKADLVLVAFKTTSNDHYQSLIGPLLHEHSRILTLQNGMGNEHRLAQLFGPQRVLGGIAFTCIHRAAPAIICHTDHGLIRAGALDPANTPDAQRVVELFRAARVPAELLPDLIRGRWEKLIWNVPFSGLGAVLDLTTDRLLASNESLALVRTLASEVVAIARAAGHEFPSDIVQHNIDITRPIGAYRTSMQIDRQLARPMELDAIFGSPLRWAHRTHTPAPFLEALHQLAQIVNLENLRKVR